jgi:hypothetical protein
MATDLTELTDQQWNKIEPWLPKHKQSPRGGRGRVNDRRMFGWRCGGPSWVSWTSKASSTGTRYSPTALLSRQKKGRLHRKNQTRKGFEAYGGGRRQGCAFGSSTYLGKPARSHARRIDDCLCEGASRRSRSASQQAAAIDLRPCRRLRSVAETAGAAWN